MKVQTTGRVLLHSLFRQRRLISGLLLTIMGTILLGSLLLPPRYEAAGSVIIRGRTYQDQLYPGRREGPWTVFMYPKEEINSEIEIIRSYPVLEAVVRAFELQKPRPIKDAGFWGAIRQGLRLGMRAAGDLLVGIGLVREPTEQEALEQAVMKLRDRMTVEPAVESQIVKVTYRDSDPVLATQAVNRILDEYLKQHLTINLNRGENTFYAEQITKITADLQALKEQLAQMKGEEGVISFSEQTNSLLRKLETFEVARANAQKEIISKRSKVTKIQELLRTNPSLLIPLPEIAQDVQIQDLENKLVNLRYQLGTALGRYTDDSRQVETTRQQIARVMDQIRHQVQQFLGREVAELRKLQAEEEALKETIANLKEETKRLSDMEPALTSLEKQIEDKQDTLTVLRKKYQDSLITQATDYRLENAKIVSPASVPIKPVVPNLPLYLSLGLLLALIVSFSTAFLIEYWDDSIRMPEDVERFLDRKVLASIAEL